MNDGNESINTRADFIKFIAELSPKIANGELKLESTTVPDLLEALGRYTEDIDGVYKNLGIRASPDQPSWRLFAQVVPGALIYE